MPLTWGAWGRLRRGDTAVGALAGGRHVALVFSGTLSRVRVAGTVARQWGGPAAPELCPLSG